MNNLKSAGVSLRTLKPNVPYDTLLADLNYNFTQVLHSPGFKGIPGESITGPEGIGVRGTKWVFVNEIKFMEVYTTLQSVEQITILFINQEFASNPTKLYTSMYIPNDTELIIGDTIVLPSGSIIELVNTGTKVEFVDTGIAFSQISALTRDDVIALIQQYIVSLDSTQSGFQYFKAEAKNAPDTQPTLNTNYTQGSVVDVDTTDAGPGYELTSYRIIAPSETNVQEATKTLLLVGSAKRYHQLIQNTQTILTNAYAPQVNTMPGLVVMQNNDENGIIFGNSNGSNFRDFGRLYRSATASILTSSFSPFAAEYSELILANNSFTVRSPETNINSQSLNFQFATKIKSRLINVSGTDVKIGGNLAYDNDAIFADHPIGATRSIILSSTRDIILRQAGLFNATILSTNDKGKIMSSYQIKQTIENSPYEVPSSAAVLAAFNNLSGGYSNNGDQINYIKNHYFGEREHHTQNVNLDNLIKFGTYSIAKTVNISSAPLLYINSAIPNISDTSPNNDTVVNVYRVQQSANNYTIAQEFIYAYPYNYSGVSIGGQRFVKFIRTGKLITSDANGANIVSVVWGVWNRQLDGLDIFFSDNDAITISGSFHKNNLAIRHKTKPSTLVDQSNAGTNVLQSLQFDEYGHVIGASSVNAANFFNQTNQDITSIITRLNVLELYARPFFEGGGLVLWNKPYNTIPAGWREVVEFRGRDAKGYDPNQTNFNQVGKYNTTGNDRVMTVAQMPKHEHFTTSRERAHGWGEANGKYLSVANEIGDKSNYVLSGVSSTLPTIYPTQAIGNNQPIDILDPYRIVVFIEPIPF